MTELFSLRERAKELTCLYEVHKVVVRRDLPPVEVFTRVLEHLPTGWLAPEATAGRIEYLGRTYAGPGFHSGHPLISEPLRVGGVVVGLVEVSTTHEGKTAFLPEEVELLRTIAARLSEYLEWKQVDLLYRPAADRTNGHWRWRQTYAELLASSLDAERFGVSALYLGGSTESGEAGPCSDIDLYVWWEGTAEKRRELSMWLEGWSLCLAQMCQRQTGYSFPGGLLNIRWLDAPPQASHLGTLRSLPLKGA
ncbi:MAG: nucleotidyltransferase domain-containing protein [Vulcanimicrobiota bacterium]